MSKNTEGQEKAYRPKGKKPKKKTIKVITEELYEADLDDNSEDDDEGVAVKFHTDSETKGLFKFDEEQHLVYGVVLVPEQVDKQDDIVDAGEIREAAHNFMLASQRLKVMHSELKKIRPVESFIAPCDMTFDGGFVVSKGSWVLVSKVLDEEVWEKIKFGTLTGYSIGGKALRVSEEI